MKGHIRERSPGHWAIVIDVPQDGKRKQRWHSFKGTKRQAQIECARLIAELQNGTAVEPSRMTVADFFERWIEHMQGQVSPRSHERYAEIGRKNLVPLIGGLTLTKLQPAHISQAYAKALASGRRDGTGGLSPRTVKHMHRVLREALQQAVRWQLLARNPADARGRAAGRGGGVGRAAPPPARGGGGGAPPPPPPPPLLSPSAGGGGG